MASDEAEAMAVDEAAAPAAAQPTPTEHFGLEPEALVGDIINAVYDYCADGIDALERCIFQVDQLGPRTLTEIQQGLDGLYGSLLSSVEAAAAGFEAAATSTCLHVPPELFMAQVALPPATASGASAAADAALESELSQLRAAILAGRGQCKRLRGQLNALERDMAAAGDASSYEPLVATVATHRDAVLEDVAAIAAAARQLQPLLSRAEALQARSGAALCLAAGRAAPALGGEEPEAAVQRATKRQAEAGASLQQLTDLSSALG